MTSPGSPSSTTSTSSSTSNTTDGALDREDMLKALASRTLAQFQIEGLSDCEDHQHDQSSLEDEEEEEEWGGIPASEADEDDAGSGTDPDFDGPEDLLQESVSSHRRAPPSITSKEPEVIVFTDPSRTTLRNQTDRELSQLERNSFMASNLSKQNRSLMDPSDRKGKRRKQEDDEEAKLSQLDRSLSNLVAHLTGPTKKSQKEDLDTILSSSLPPMKAGGSKNGQRHPRRMKAGMAQAQLQRSLAADREAEASGTVRAANAKTASKRQKRVQDGSVDRLRRARKTFSDRIPLGKSTAGGLLKLSSRDIRNTTSHPRQPSKGKR
ncbi:hypothetical protein PCASD_13642 [Puccinia coronata f. sp. avenae]|nr:hypothetical protein PCASD_19425 [Puccinia coronata f. sp. avenae]PLW31306.1 hypothetical protein PCASD_13642 [Puccinia coronata f. sp. avenae]